MKKHFVDIFNSVCQISAGYLMMFIVLFGFIFIISTKPTHNLSKLDYTNRFVDINGRIVSMWDFYSVNDSTDLYCRLEAIDSNTTLEFVTQDTFVSVYANDHLLYEDARPSNAISGVSNGVSWKRIILPASVSPTVIKITCTPAFKDKYCSLTHCYIGAPEKVVFEVAFEHFPALFISFFFLAVGFIAIILFFYYEIRYKTGKNFLYIGYTSVITALWSIFDTTMLPYFFGNSAFWTMLEYLVFLMVPLSMGLVCSFRFTGKAKFYTNIYILACELNILICCILHFTGLLEFYYTKWSTIFLNILAVPLLFLLIFTYTRGKVTYTNHMMFVTFFLTLFSCILMWIFRTIEGYVYDTSFVVRTSIICLQTCLIGYHLKNTSIDYRNNIEKKVRHEFLILDQATGLYNRSALIEKHPGYTNTDGNSCVAVACFFLNNLEKINNDYGYEAGAQLITDFSSGLHFAFPDSDCYRLDQTKFLVIIKRDSADHVFQQGLNNLETYRNDYNTYRSHFYIMDYSYSYEYDTNVTLFNLIEQAEANINCDC